MERFIYVIGEDARDRLVNMGYHLLREDEAIQFAMSDTLTF